MFFLKNRLSQMAITALVFASSTAAHAEFKLPESGTENSYIKAVEGYINSWIIFATGPYASFVIAGSVIIGASLWVLAPKSPAMQYLMRAAAVGIGFLNFPVLLNTLSILK